MRRNNRRTSFVCVTALVVLFALALLSAGASRLGGATQQNKSGQTKPEKDLVQKQKEMDARFPTVDYDSPESTSTEEKAKRAKRNKHYDRGNWVMKNPSSESTAIAIDSHAFFALPPLPVAQSDTVLSADVLTSEAHLSNDKTGVYSEFTVQVDEIFKGGVSTSSQGNVITISRQGGKVRYPSGHVQRYEIMNQAMPVIGKRYLFFLKAVPDSDDFEIVTAYDIGSGHVIPLDGGQFESFRGKSVVEFVNIVRDAITKN